MNITDHPLYLPLKIEPSPLTSLITQRELQGALSVAVKLDLFSKLKKAQTLKELCNSLGINHTVAYYLLQVLVHVGCLMQNDDNYMNTALADTYLVPASHLYLGYEFLPQAGDEFAAQLMKGLRSDLGEKSPEPDWNQERLRQIGVFGLMGSIQSTVKVCQLQGVMRGTIVPTRSVLCAAMKILLIAELLE
jgi:hypothetical protein